MIVRGGTVVLPGVVPVAADVAIEDGAIAAIGPELDPSGEEIDARGLHVLPGALDAHVHAAADRHGIPLPTDVPPDLLD